MSKVRGLGLAIIAMLFCLGITFAQDAGENKEPAAQEKANEKQMEKERLGAMAMQMMGSMQKQMATVNDGGVIVLVGNKLLKYDKDLNFVKEAELNTGVELKMDSGSIQEMMKSMKGKYGKRSKMMQGDSQGAEKQ